MITVSTLETSAQLVTAAAASITGATLIAVASISTTSACLPGVSEPVRSSRPATWAPLMVAISSIWRALSMFSGTSVLASQATALTLARSVPKAERIWVNMSPGAVVTTSIERLGRRPYSIAFMTGGQPCPICTSICGAIEMVPPESATSRHSSSEK